MIDVDNNFKSHQRVIASLAVFLLWAKVFDWLRLFEITSFYIKLVQETFRDLTSFMILFFSGLGMFGFSLYMLQPTHNSSTGNVIEPVSGIFVIDAIRN